MLLTVHVKTNARQNALEWLDADTIKIHVTAPPEKGKANHAIITLLANELAVSKSSVEIVRGATAKLKQIRIKKTP